MKKYIFLPGGLLVVAALLWAAFTLAWDRTALFLGAGGLLVLALGTAANAKEIRDWFRDPRGVFALNTTISTLIFVAILGVVNALVAFRPVSFDVTEAGRNTLSDEARTLVAGLTQDVWIKQFGRSRDMRVADLLEAFARAGTRVRPSFVDIERAPTEAREYAPIKDGTVVVGSGDKFRKINQVTEPALATAILQVTSESQITVCFATGEGERGLLDQSGTGLSELAKALVASNFAMDRVSLLQSGVPESCGALVVAGPTSALQPVEYERLETYLFAGGRIAVLIDPPVDRGLAAWLTKYGVAPGQGMIIETSPAAQSVGAGPETPMAVGYYTHPITRGFEVTTVYHRAVPLLPVKTDFGQLSPLAGTGSESFERVDLMSQSVRFQEGRDRPGPHVLAAALSIARGSADAALPEPRLVVFGDSDFLTNAFITRQGNRDLALRVIAWLSGEEESRAVAVAERQNRRTSLSLQGRTWLYLVTLGFLPLIPLVAGVIRLIRSRR